MPVTRHVIVRLNGREYDVELSDHTSRVNGQPISLETVADGEAGITIKSGGRRLSAVVDRGEDDIRVHFLGHELNVECETERHRLLQRFASKGSKTHVHADVRAKMPGLVVRVNCHAGMEIQKGQAIIILEAMKMENEIRSPVDGILKEVHVQQGQAVEKGDLLVTLD